MNTFINRQFRSLPRIGRQFLALFLSCLLTVQPVFAQRQTTYLHTDALGSVVAATNESGDLVWRKAYAPFGQQIDTDTDDESISFTGKTTDDTGLVYFGARYYDPLLHIFLGVDSAGVLGNVESNPAMFNRYSYAANNPYKYVDPDGNFTTYAIPMAALLILVAVTPVALNYTGAQISDGGFGPTAYPGKTISMGPEATSNSGGFQLDGVTIQDLIQTATEVAKGEGKRRKNRIPDKGEPNTVAENPAGTTRKKYGSDGNVQKEWNKGHGPKAPKNEQNDHIHDYKPNPQNPSGRGERMPGREPRSRDLNDMDLL